MVEGRFWRWTLSAERPAIVHVQREEARVDFDGARFPAEPPREDAAVVVDSEAARFAAPPRSSVLIEGAALALTDHVVRKPGQLAPIINRLSLTFQGGRTHFVVGVNGVGKTLFLKSLTALPRTCALTRGKAKASAQVCYFTSRERVCEEPISVFQLLRMARASSGIQAWGLETCAHTRVQHLSQGEKTRLALALAEAACPYVLLLDEPTLGLDQAGLERLQRLLARRREDGLVTLVATHELILFGDEGGELIMFEHDHERTRVLCATGSILRGHVRYELDDGECVELRGAAPEIARAILQLQRVRLRGDG